MENNILPDLDPSLIHLLLTHLNTSSRIIQNGSSPPSIRGIGTSSFSQLTIVHLLWMACLFMMESGLSSTSSCPLSPQKMRRCNSSWDREPGAIPFNLLTPFFLYFWQFHCEIVLWPYSPPLPCFIFLPFLLTPFSQLDHPLMWWLFFFHNFSCPVVTYFSSAPVGGVLWDNPRKWKQNWR